MEEIIQGQGIIQQMQPMLPAMNQHQTQSIPNSYQQNRNNQTVINHANTVTNFSGNSYKSIFLENVNAEVNNLDNRNIEKYYIFFDSGAQRTYITKSLCTMHIHYEIMDKLNLLPIPHERISIKVFGTTDSKIQEIEIVKFKVKGISKNIFVEALVIPIICSTLTNQDDNSVSLSKYQHLRNLR